MKKRQIENKKPNIENERKVLPIIIDRHSYGWSERVYP